ncbi:hypothetical protein [Chitinophaga sp. S165]|uniref:hypothetical protein n=1 Tax=Chitinophaga sp. S165 TaxID=2135462 RepID=UPI000D712607|nr:hypothetical protein [Chitinophaga sp. S165]PWV56012.1 hypothetical protein C7475_101525 [Chitinophaga sp. S165]
MGKQQGILPFTGQLGDRVGYLRNGKYFLRRKALEVRQSPATKRAAKDFGTASKAGAQLRHALYTELHRYYDSNVITRLNKALTGAIQNDQYRPAGERRLNVTNMQSLNDFHFSAHSNHQRLLSCTQVISEDVQGRVQLSFSGLRPNAPKGVTDVSIKAIIISANFERSALEVSASETVTITNRKPCDAITLTIGPIPGTSAAHKGLRIVLIEVQPHIGVNGQLLPSGNRQGYALDVIAVLPPVSQLVKVQREYKNNAPLLKIIPRYPNLKPQRVFNPPFVKGSVDLLLLPSLTNDH